MDTDARFFSHSSMTRRAFVAAGTAAAATTLSPAVLAQSTRAATNGDKTFRRIRTQFIAALAAPDEKSGDNAQAWGLWRRDPGPRGVRLSQYEQLRDIGGVAPAGWRFDSGDWWLEENGLIMEKPEFPLAAGQYLVTGDREVTTVLTVGPPDTQGNQSWALADDATVYDVTHLRCRSARYTPSVGTDSCSPSQAKQSEFPVTPGAEMPPVAGCDKQDYAVLFVIGIAA